MTSIYPVEHSALPVFILNLGKMTENAGFVDMLIISQPVDRRDVLQSAFSQLQPLTLYKNAQSLSMIAQFV